MKKTILILVLALAVLVSCTSCKKKAEYLPDIPPTPRQEMRWDVKTDYSGLTDGAQPIPAFTRLHEGPLPELVPSKDYGMLLPYASSVIADEIGLWEVKHGLVTIDGVIVTDLVYDGVYRAYYQSNFGDLPPAPAYMLSVTVPGEEMSAEQTNQTNYAACALDGSWITPFDYETIAFTEKTIVLLHSYDSYDIDVYDYDGQRLYNMLDMEWIDDLSGYNSPASIAYNIFEGYGFVQMEDGTYSVIDIRTGRMRHTQFTNTGTFSEGLAMVSPSNARGLWGYANTDLELVIPPIYSECMPFKNGRAIVTTESGGQLLIDKQGETLFSVGPDYYIDQAYGDPNFSVRTRSGLGPASFYDSDFVEINLRQEAYTQDSYTYLYQLYGGLCSYYIDGGTVLLAPDGERFFPGSTSIHHADGKYVVWSEYGDDGNQSNIETMDGKAIIPAVKNTDVTVILKDDEAIAFVLNAGMWRGDNKEPTYKLVDTDGNIVASGAGVMAYDWASGLCSVRSLESYSWLHPDGSLVVKIPLMSYMLD